MQVDFAFTWLSFGSSPKPDLCTRLSCECTSELLTGKATLYSVSPLSEVGTGRLAILSLDFLSNQFSLSMQASLWVKALAGSSFFHQTSLPLFPKHSLSCALKEATILQKEWHQVMLIIVCLITDAKGGWLGVALRGKFWFDLQPPLVLMTGKWPNGHVCKSAPCV